MQEMSTSGVRATVLDLLGYGGVALAIAGTVIALEGAGLTTQTIAGAAVTVVLLGAGWLVGGSGAGDAQHRMRGIFWFVALQSWSQVISVLLGADGADLQGRSLILASGLLLAVLAVPLWFMEKRSLQLIGAFSAVLTVAGALVYSETEVFGSPIPNIRWMAVVTAVLGAGLLVMGMWGAARPRRTAMVLGSLALIAGVTLATIDVVGLALSGGNASDVTLIALVATSVLVVFAGERAGIVAVFGIGIIGMIAGIAALVGEHVEGDVGGVIVVVAGVVLLGATIALITKKAPAAPVMPEAPAAPAAPDAAPEA
ncbi:MAG: hypothetical protein WD096_03665 [Actinomycetota bacterium]